MPGESENFSFGKIDWNYITSKRITSSRTLPSRQRGGPRVADVSCKECGESWQAFQGGISGGFSLSPGVMLIECPGCGVSDAVKLKDLE